MESSDGRAMVNIEGTSVGVEKVNAWFLPA
jgi:hypothetical protein